MTENTTTETKPDIAKTEEELKQQVEQSTKVGKVGIIVTFILGLLVSSGLLAGAWCGAAWLVQYIVTTAGLFMEGDATNPETTLNFPQDGDYYYFAIGGLIGGLFIFLMTEPARRFKGIDACLLSAGICFSIAAAAFYQLSKYEGGSRELLILINALALAIWVTQSLDRFVPKWMIGILISGLISTVVFLAAVLGIIYLAIDSQINAQLIDPKDLDLETAFQKLGILCIAFWVPIWVTVAAPSIIYRIPCGSKPDVTRCHPDSSNN